MLLQDWKAGDTRALDELVPLVYGELHKLATHHMKAERRGHTLRPTELVAEAYVRLAEGGVPALHDRAHFYGIAARTMRQILVDHARKRMSHKRGDGARPVTF